MKKKKYITKEGKIISIGDPVSISEESSGKSFKLVTNSLDEFSVSILKKNGYIKDYDEKDSEEKPKNGGIQKNEKVASELTSEDIGIYAAKVAERLHMSGSSLKQMFLGLGLFSPHTLLNLFLMEIAIDLDRKYHDHIKKSEKIYTISMTNGLIVEVPKSTIKSFHGFPAFRTIEDAKIACKLTSPLIRFIFKVHGKK